MSPVIATILMVAITVVLAAVLYVMVSGLIQGPGQTPQLIGISPTQSGSNWKLTVTSAPAGTTVASVSLAVTSSDGSSVLLSATPLSALSGGNDTWVKIGADASLIQPGDYILLAILAFPAGSQYQLLGASGVMASGTLG